MNTKEIFREELARQGVLNSFPATPENLKSFMGAIEAAQIRMQTAFNELQQKLVNSEQSILNKDTAINNAAARFSELEAKFVNKQNEVDNLNARIESLQKMIVEFQNDAQGFHQSLSDKDSIIERQKTEMSSLQLEIIKLKSELEKLRN